MYVHYYTLCSLADFLARMGVWVLDGVVWHKELLPFVLNEKNVDNSLVMIVVDLTQPWTVVESLERWSEVIYRHINSLKIPDRQRRAMEEKSMLHFLSMVSHTHTSHSSYISFISCKLLYPLQSVSYLSCLLISSFFITNFFVFSRFGAVPSALEFACFVKHVTWMLACVTHILCSVCSLRANTDIFAATHTHTDTVVCMYYISQMYMHTCTMYNMTTIASSWWHISCTAFYSNSWVIIELSSMCLWFRRHAQNTSIGYPEVREQDNHLMFLIVPEPSIWILSKFENVLLSNECMYALSIHVSYQQ